MEEKRKYSTCTDLTATPEEERICLLCDLGQADDEVHYLFYCPVYADLKDIFLRKMTLVSTDLFELDDHDICEFCFSKATFCVTYFICKAWDVRQNTLFGSGLSAILVICMISVMFTHDICKNVSETVTTVKNGSACHINLKGWGTLVCMTC